MRIAGQARLLVTAALVWVAVVALAWAGVEKKDARSPTAAPTAASNSETPASDSKPTAGTNKDAKPAASAAPSTPGSQKPAAQPTANTLRVARLVYGGGKSSECFSDSFLADVARRTAVPMERTFDTIELKSEKLFDYPLVIMSGEGAFELTESEIENLRTFIAGGGTLLASSGCSNFEWSKSFRAAMGKVVRGLAGAPAGDDILKPVPTEHKIFHTIYEIQGVRPKKSDSEALVKLTGMEVGGRLAVIFSPLGLNDTADVGGKCCCCGGNEIREAKLINANIVAYALIH